MRKYSKILLALAIFILIPAACILTACGGKPTTQDGEYSIVKIAFVEAGFGRQFLLDWEADYNKKHPDSPIDKTEYFNFMIKEIW